MKVAERITVRINKFLTAIYKLIGDFGLGLNTKPRPFTSYFPKIDSKTVVLFNKTALILCLLLFSFSLYTSLKTRTEYSLKQFYPADHPLLIEEQKISHLFKLEKNLSVIVLLQTKDKHSWLETPNLQTLKKLTAAFQKNEKLKSVTSIATLQGTQDNGEQLDVGSLFESEDLNQRKKVANTHPFVKPHLLSKDESATLLVLNLYQATPAEVSTYAENLKTYFAEQYPSYQFSIGGLSALQADMSALLKKEMLRSAVIGFLLFVLGLLLIYKNPKSIFTVLIALLFVNTVVLGGLALFNIPLNVLLSTLPILISLDVISLVIHIQGHLAKTNKLFATYKDLFWENLLALITTGLGFLFLKTSSSELIQNYGLIVCVSSLASWFLTHLIYIPLFIYFKNVEFRTWLLKPAYWSLWSLKHRKLVLSATSIVFVVGAYSFTKINWNAKALDDLPEHQDTRKTTEFLDKHFGGTLEMNFVIHNFKKQKNWEQVKNIKKLETALAQIKKLSTVGSVISVNDFYKSLASQSRPNRLPASNSDLSEKNFLFSLSNNNPIDGLLSDDKKNLLLKVRYRDVPSNKVDKTTFQIESILKDAFPLSKITSSGFAEQFHTLNKEISKDLVFNFWHAILVIGLILAFVFKSWKLALLACLPNLLPPLVLLSWLNYQQVSLKPSIAIIFSIAIGLAFTNTVYIIGRILKLKKTLKTKNYLPLKRALLEEGNPCLLATLLVGLGFVVFLFSYFSINRAFGQYMLLSVGAALLGDLIFMPSFLQQFKKYFVSLALVTFLFSEKSFAAVDNSVDILKKAQLTLSSTDDIATVTMKNTEADGKSNSRTLTLKRKFSNQKNQILVKILKPTDQKGAGFLSVIENSSEQNWIYLPSSKQVRRFVSKNKKEGVLGSELNPQDIDLTTIQAASAKTLKIQKAGTTEIALIEVKSKSNQTLYSKAIIWMQLSQFVPLRIEYYDAKGAAIKRIDFQNYALFNNVQRAQKITIKNLKNKRATELLLTQIKVNSGLKDDAFTQRALSKD